MGIRKLILGFSLFAGVCFPEKGTAQNKLELGLDGFIGSSYLRASGIQTLLFKGSTNFTIPESPSETESPKSENLFGHGRIGLSLELPQVSKYGVFLEARYHRSLVVKGPESGFDLVRFGNDQVRSALLDKSRFVGFAYQSIGIGFMDVTFGRFSFQPSFHLSSATNIHDLKIVQGSIQTNDFGDRVDLTYDYDWTRSKSRGYGGFLNLKMEFELSSKQRFHFDLDHLGGHYVSNSIRSEKSGDTSLTGFNLQNLISGGNQGQSLKQTFTSGDTTAQFIQMPIRYSFGYQYELTNGRIHGMVHQEIGGVSPLWLTGAYTREWENQFLTVQGGIGTQSMYQIGMGYGFNLGPHAFMLKSNSFLGWLVPEKGKMAHAAFTYSFTFAP